MNTCPAAEQNQRQLRTVHDACCVDILEANKLKDLAKLYFVQSGNTIISPKRKCTIKRHEPNEVQHVVNQTSTTPTPSSTNHTQSRTPFLRGAPEILTAQGLKDLCKANVSLNTVSCRVMIVSQLVAAGYLEVLGPHLLNPFVKKGMKRSLFAASC